MSGNYYDAKFKQSVVMEIRRGGDLRRIAHHHGLSEFLIRSWERTWHHQRWYEVGTRPGKCKSKSEHLTRY